jgi:hypothetical protein
MPYSLKQAADATGRTKPTLLRAIQTGKISAKKNEIGEWEIEPAELHRVYPPIAQGVTLTGKPNVEEAVELLLFRQELTAKEEQLTALWEEREQERREKDRQLTALLTDQSGRGEKGSSVPAVARPPMLRFFKYLRLWRQ